MLRTRIKKITYANGMTLAFPQVRLLLFWRYFHRLRFDTADFFWCWRSFFRDTVLFRTKNAIGIPINIGLPLDNDYVDNKLRAYYKSYVCYVNSHKIKKTEVINKDYSDYIVYINHDKQEQQK